MGYDPQPFAGPWTLLVTVNDAGADQRFVIWGSDNADGAYDVVLGTTVSVEGDAWQVSLLWNDGTWNPSRVVRRARATTTDGLVVSLSADDGLPADEDFDFNDLVVVARSDDESISPPTTAGWPPDFTIPGGGGVR